jgi:hypothetical protein
VFIAAASSSVSGAADLLHPSDSRPIASVRQQQTYCIRQIAADLLHPSDSSRPIASLRQQQTYCIPQTAADLLHPSDSNLLHPSDSRPVASLRQQPIASLRQQPPKFLRNIFPVLIFRDTRIIRSMLPGHRMFSLPLNSPLCCSSDFWVGQLFVSLPNGH